MKTEFIYELTSTFEAHAQLTENGIEFWLARDLQHLLGYTEWRNFATVISKAKTACEVSGHPITDHFVDVTKMVELGSDSKRDVDDLGQHQRAIGNLSDGPSYFPRSLQKRTGRFHHFFS